MKNMVNLFPLTRTRLRLSTRKRLSLEFRELIYDIQPTGTQVDTIQFKEIDVIIIRTKKISHNLQYKILLYIRRLYYICLFVTQEEDFS